MDSETASAVARALDWARSWWPEFTGGGVAYFMHHFMHKGWHQIGKLGSLFTKKEGKT